MHALGCRTLCDPVFIDRSARGSYILRVALDSYTKPDMHTLTQACLAYYDLINQFVLYQIVALPAQG